jgi:hypothetical protein
VRSIHFDPDAWEDFLYWLGATTSTGWFTGPTTKR